MRKKIIIIFLIIIKDNKILPFIYREKVNPSRHKYMKNQTNFTTTQNISKKRKKYISRKFLLKTLRDNHN